jgi:DNA (cytosine-5)-methyltransferase 1
MTAYYNEHDPYAAQWLRNLIAAGHIAPGDVDERSIEDVFPSDLAGYTQCHFFAGIGVWSFALRNAGWPDDKPVWTGSCPCQPFSAAGQGKGFADERHLWPAWFHLIEQRRPSVVFGEQVDGNDGFAWLDLVQTDLEALDYAVGTVVLPAAGFGAPHGRHRIFFVADTEHDRCKRRHAGGPRTKTTLSHSEIGGMAYTQSGNIEWMRKSGKSVQGKVGGCCATSRMEQPENKRRQRRAEIRRETRGGPEFSSQTCCMEYSDRSEQDRESSVGMQPLYEECNRSGGGFTRGFWGAADWIPCRDGKWRPIEPGTFPLAHGVAGRMGQLRAYGNAIVAPVAEAFIRAYIGEA